MCKRMQHIVQICTGYVNSPTQVVSPALLAVCQHPLWSLPVMLLACLAISTHRKRLLQWHASACADTFFCVVDLHAITMPHDPKALRQASHSTAAAYLAAGVDTSKSSIFMQSHVPGHSELAWLLGCYTPIGWLQKMIQFKVCLKAGC